MSGQYGKQSVQRSAAKSELHITPLQLQSRPEASRKQWKQRRLSLGIAHALDTIDDHLLLENIRDILSDINQDINSNSLKDKNEATQLVSKKSQNEEDSDIKSFIYYRLNAQNDKRIQRRINHIMTEIEKQDVCNNKCHICFFFDAHLKYINNLL